MLYTDHIQKALDYMEDHLAGECRLDDCAHAAGYSVYHFIRIFKDMTRLSPIDYLRKRRLAAAVRDIADSPLPIGDIAFRWGFESAETFIRAFVSEHGITPGRFRAAGCSLHLTEPFRKPVGEPFDLPEPEIKEMPERTMCGFPLNLSPGTRHGIIPSFWNQYHERRLAEALPGTPADGWFEDVGCSLSDQGRLVSYVCGTWSNKPGPSQTVFIKIPTGRYAIFATPPADNFTFVETIHRTWQAIIGQWLPASPYAHGIGPDYESYCEKSQTFTENIFIPIIRKE